jgi:hypothetical protein
MASKRDQARMGHQIGFIVRAESAHAGVLHSCRYQMRLTSLISLQTSFWLSTSGIRRTVRSTEYDHLIRIKNFSMRIARAKLHQGQILVRRGTPYGVLRTAEVPRNLETGAERQGFVRDKLDVAERACNLVSIRRNWIDPSEISVWIDSKTK